MIVTINGQTVSVQGNKDNAYPAFERNCKEERDFANLIIVSERSTRYEMYDRVDVTSPTEQYLIQGDTVTQLNATDYEHSLTLIETIAYFDTIYPADRSFRKLGQTLEDILTVYERELDTYYNIQISWDTLTTAELNETIPFKEFVGANFSQILQSLFRKIWAVPKVNYSSGSWDIYPQYHFERNNSIDSEAISKTWQQNNVEYATRVKTQLKNAVNENVSVWYPSETGYVLPRSSTYEKVTSKLRYELDSPILAIDTATVVDASVIIKNRDTGTFSTITVDIDLTNYIVQNDVWDLLKSVTSDDNTTDNARNHIRFQPLQRYITSLYETGTDNIIFTSDTEYLLNAIKRELTKNPDDYFDNTIYIFEGDLGLNYETEDVKMRFKYYRQRDMDIIHSRKTKGNMNKSTTAHTQRDSSVEAGQYLRNLKLYSNRMGNKTYSKTKMFSYDETPYEVFDYTDSKTIVTRRKHIYHPDFIMCEYEESENFANLETEFALMRSTDPYTISGKSVTTNLIYEEFVEFSLTDKTDDTTRLTDDAKRLLVGQFETSVISINPVAVGVFKPDLISWDSDYAIHMPVEVTGNGNNISMHVYFDHQNIAAKTYYDLENDTLQTYLNPLAYTDSDGRLEDFYLYLTNDVQFNDTGEYPLILDETNYLVSNLTTNGIKEPIDLDSNAAFAYTFAVSFTADDNIYIGDKMARDNYIFNEQSTSSIQIWKSTKPYGEYDQAPRSTDTNVTASVSYSYNATTYTHTITPSTRLEYFCLVKDGEILLALNQNVAIGQTLNIYTNFLVDSNTVYISASTSGLSSLTASASLAYTFRYYDLSASASGLADLTASASLAYTSIEYSLSASASGLSNLQASAVLSITSSEYSLSASASGLASLQASASVEYTERSYVLEANASGLASLSASASLTITDSEYVLSASASGLSDLSASCSISVPPPAVEWVQITSGTPDTNQCLYVTDEGNIKSEDVQDCVFQQDGATYTSPINRTSTQPTCSEGASYTVCLPDGQGAYVCQDYEGTITTVTYYYECQLI